MVYLVIEYGGEWEDSYSSLLYVTQSKEFAEKLSTQYAKDKQAEYENARAIIGKYDEVDMTPDEEKMYEGATHVIYRDYLGTRVLEAPLNTEVDLYLG